MTTPKTRMRVDVRGEVVRGMALLAQYSYESARLHLETMVADAIEEYYSDLEIELVWGWNDGGVIWEGDQFLLIYIADEYADGTEIERAREGRMLQDLLQHDLLSMLWAVSRERD